jgi:hypothetical protein
MCEVGAYARVGALARSWRLAFIQKTALWESILIISFGQNFRQKFYKIKKYYFRTIIVIKGTLLKLRQKLIHRILFISFSRN